MPVIANEIAWPPIYRKKLHGLIFKPSQNRPQQSGQRSMLPSRSRYEPVSCPFMAMLVFACRSTQPRRLSSPWSTLRPQSSHEVWQ